MDPVRPTIEAPSPRSTTSVLPDFGQGRTVIQDAYVNARFKPGAQVQLGKFKAPIGLERLQSANDMRWVQRGFPTSLVTNRDIGLQLAGDLAGGRFSYQAAYLNGSNDGSSSETFTDLDINDDKEYALRLFTHPFAESDSFALRGLGFGSQAPHRPGGNATQALCRSSGSPASRRSFASADGHDGTGIPPSPTASASASRRSSTLRGALGVLGEYTEVRKTCRARSRRLREATATRTPGSSRPRTSYGEEASFRGSSEDALLAERGTGVR